MPKGQLWISLGVRTKKFEQGLRNAKNSVRKFSGQFKRGLGGLTPFSLGVVGGIIAIGTALKNAFKKVVEFQKANSELKAVLGGTKQEMAELSKQAKNLGSTTKFTANEVVGLQTSFAKLGFKTDAIKQMAASTLDAAAALGSELSEQATLTGATLRSFNLDASKTTHVNDVLAKAASSSALDFEKLSTALPIVGATARTAGVSLERTTALIGTLADRGIDASTAGTALRNVFLELNKKGLSFNDAMKKIQNSTNKNKTALELFGKRGATVGVILSETRGHVDELTGALIKSDDAAKDMAATMLDNLAGDVTKAGSAWEGFVLSLDSGNGVISSAFRKVTKESTGFLQFLTDLNNKALSTSDVFKRLGNSILKVIAPNTGVKFDVTKDKIDAFEKAMRKQNIEQINTFKGITRLTKQYQSYGLTLREARKRTSDLISSMTPIKQKVDESTKAIEEQNAKIKEDTKAIEEQNAKIKEDTKAKKKATAAQQKLNKKIDQFAESLRKVDYSEIKAGNDELAAADDAFNKIIKTGEDLQSKLADKQIKIQIKADTEAAEAKMKRLAERTQRLKENTNLAAEALNQGFSSMANTIVSNLGLADEGIQGFEKSMLSVSLKIMARALSVAMANAITGATGAAAVAGPFAPAVLPATIAEMVGVTLSAFASIPKFANGGLAFGASIGMVGEGIGTTRSNPEVIAPLDKLKNFIQPQGGGGEVKFRIEGNQLVGVLKRQNKLSNFTN